MITKPDIAVGQIWRDKDKRREEDGTVRTFRVTLVLSERVHCVDIARDRKYSFQRHRFGGGARNDSFERVL
jgi:hypothetical protein